ncbi:hypothetical protein HYW41_01095 [Candidatus Daviesbacteria bacterium]|nr:hypothetical protein [Candidatus Daviesbacteria bacterium]MBI2596732.1 hypothetical protein [Candidatus Daviesbacteria bacterium]
MGKYKIDNDLLRDAIELMKEYTHVSPSLFQRRLMLNYYKACDLYNELKKMGLIVQTKRAKPGKAIINFRDAGDPVKLAKKYSDEGADELVFLDIRAGADKVSVNTGAFKNPKLISDCAKEFGSQCVVLSFLKLKDYLRSKNIPIRS